MTAALTFQDLTLGYDRHPAVHHLTGVVMRGSLLAVVGPNGAGKSTLLKGIAGVLRPIGGSITRSGGGPHDIAYLPQAAEIDRSFPLSLHEFVAMGVWRQAGIFGGVGAVARQRIAEAIAAVGLTGFENRTFGTLSGGQFQRALFARLMLQEASTILLDEPFTAIDQRTTADLLAIIRRWHEEQRTVIAVLHDFALVREVFPDALLLAREPIAWGKAGDVLSASHLLAARRMVETFASDAEICERAA